MLQMVEIWPFKKCSGSAKLTVNLHIIYEMYKKCTLNTIILLSTKLVIVIEEFWKNLKAELIITYFS